jgi:hypothetical protein
MSEVTESNLQPSIIPAAAAVSAVEQAATASVLDEMKGESDGQIQPRPEGEAGAFSELFGPQEMSKMLMNATALPIAFWSTGMSLACSLWLSALFPSRDAGVAL